MEGTFISKLSFCVVIFFTISSCFSTTNARRKHVHHHRHSYFPVRPYIVEPQPPTTAPPPELPQAPPQSLSYAPSPSIDESPAPPLPPYALPPCIEEPETTPPLSYPPPPLPPPYDGGVETPPYQSHGCGLSCNNSYDCISESCPICCPDKTCCFDYEPLPLPTYAPSPAPQSTPSEPPSLPPSLGDDDTPAPQLPPYDMDVAVIPPQEYEYQPYQVHGCGHSCLEPYDCDWPCTACCANRNGNSTCCYDEFMFP